MFVVFGIDDDDFGVIGDYGLDLVLLFGDGVVGWGVLYVCFEVGFFEIVGE